MPQQNITYVQTRLNSSVFPLPYMERHHFLNSKQMCTFRILARSTAKHANDEPYTRMRTQCVRVHETRALSCFVALPIRDGKSFSRQLDTPASSRNSIQINKRSYSRFASVTCAALDTKMPFVSDNRRVHGMRTLHPCARQYRTVHPENAVHNNGMEYPLYRWHAVRSGASSSTDMPYNHGHSDAVDETICGDPESARMNVPQQQLTVQMQSKRRAFPLAAIKGNEQIKLAVLLCAVRPHCVHVHAFVLA